MVEGQGDVEGALVGIEHDEGLLPTIADGWRSVDGEGDCHMATDVEKSKSGGYGLSGGELEKRMLSAQVDESAQGGKELVMQTLSAPVDGVYHVGAVVAVAHSALAAQ